MKRRVDEACARLKQAPIYYCAIADKSIEYAVSLMNQFSNTRWARKKLMTGRAIRSPFPSLPWSSTTRSRSPATLPEVPRNGR